MASSIVDKYEQILAADPRSRIFVELAKALVERGEHARAVEVCRRGLEFHPGSILGRVVWCRVCTVSRRIVMPRCPRCRSADMRRSRSRFWERPFRWTPFAPYRCANCRWRGLRWRRTMAIDAAEDERFSPELPFPEQYGRDPQPADAENQPARKYRAAGRRG